MCVCNAFGVLGGVCFWGCVLFGDVFCCSDVCVMSFVCHTNFVLSCCMSNLLNDLGRGLYVLGYFCFVIFRRHRVQVNILYTLVVRFWG